MSDVVVLQSSGSQILDDAAVKCASRGWRFKPAMKDGKPVAVKMTTAVNWRLH
jgi:TonB family protein